jgi:AraC-like DNA-binding protein
MQPLNLQIEPAALRRYRYFESDDIDETCERIGSVLQPHRLTPGAKPRNGSAYMNMARLDTITFGSLNYSGSMNVEASELANYYLVIICLNGFAEVSVGEKRALIGETRGVIVGPQTRFGGSFSSDCEQLFIRVEKQSVLAYSGYERLHLDPTLDLTRPELAPWLFQLRTLAASPETVALAQRDRRAANDLERLFIGLLLAGQPHRSDRRAASCTPMPRTVRRAEAYIHEHAREPLTLADIAFAADVPIRTLLDCFKRFRGESPMKVVRDVRLDAARQSLVHAGERERVADIALGSGFGNLGRFAIAYREKFGESPSETLRRVRPERR